MLVDLPLHWIFCNIGNTGSTIKLDVSFRPLRRAGITIGNLSALIKGCDAVGFANLASLEIVVPRRFLQEDSEQGDKRCRNLLFLRFLVNGFIHSFMMTAVCG